MLTQDDLGKIKAMFDDQDKRFDIKLKKALRGVARKKDLRLLENRITKKINFIIDRFDGRFLRIETHLNLPPVSF